MGLGAETSARFSRVLRESRDDVVERWVATAGVALRGRPVDGELGRQIGQIYTDLETLFASGAADLESAAASDLRATLGDLSRNWARQGFTPRETATCVFAGKEPLAEALESDGASPAQILAVHRFLDQMGLYTFEVYVQARDELISEQAEQLLELATPVVKLWDGVVAVPLVGTLDSTRSQIVTEKLLQTLVDMGAHHAILDITGVPAVDSQVAQHLLKTAMAARLMGAECVISGIRPQIAQTVVALGIDFGSIVTKATLADALLYSLRASGVSVVGPHEER